MFIGREGDGPGEFRAPARIAVTDTLVHVIDGGRSSLQQYRLDGTHVADHRIGDAMVSGGEVSREGAVIVPTSGTDSALARLYSLAGSTRRIGAPIVPWKTWDLVAMKAEIAKGRVPDQLRNDAVPAFGADDTIWLLVQTEAEVRRYDADGRLVWRRVLDVPEIQEARREFFRRNAADDRPMALALFRSMTAAREVGDRLWVLMHGESGTRRAVFYVLDRDNGHVVGRVSVDVPDAVNRFAIDATRGKLYLAVPNEASVLAADVGELLRR